VRGRCKEFFTRNCPSFCPLTSPSLQLIRHPLHLAVAHRTGTAQPPAFKNMSQHSKFVCDGPLPSSLLDSRELKDSLPAISPAPAASTAGSRRPIPIQEAVSALAPLPQGFSSTRADLNSAAATVPSYFLSSQASPEVLPVRHALPGSVVYNHPLPEAFLQTTRSQPMSPKYSAGSYASTTSSAYLSGR
jgi:hypothetical protein